MMDAYDMWKHHEQQQEARLKERPVYYNCDEPIQDNRAFYDDHVWICMDCLKRDFIRDVEDFV